MPRLEVLLKLGEGVSERRKRERDSSSYDDNSVAGKRAQQQTGSRKDSSLSIDFFSGKIRDHTTDHSRKKDKTAAILNTKLKNPAWKPVDGKVH